MQSTQRSLTVTKRYKGHVVYICFKSSTFVLPRKLFTNYRLQQKLIKEEVIHTQSTRDTTGNSDTGKPASPQGCLSILISVAFSIRTQSSPLPTWSDAIAQEGAPLPRAELSAFQLQLEREEFVSVPFDLQSPGILLRARAIININMQINY